MAKEKKVEDTDTDSSGESAKKQELRQLIENWRKEHPTRTDRDEEFERLLENTK